MLIISHYSSYYGFFNNLYLLNYRSRMYVRLQFIITDVVVSDNTVNGYRPRCIRGARLGAAEALRAPYEQGRTRVPPGTGVWGKRESSSQRPVVPQRQSRQPGGS